MAVSPALQTLFNNFVAGIGALFVWRLYTITLFGGGQVRFTDADFDIKAVSSSPLVNGYLYSSSGIRVDQKGSKTQAHLKIGTDTDTWTLVLMPRPFDPVSGAVFPDTIGSVPWIQAAQGGALDAADFQVDEAYFSTMPTWPMPPGGAQPVGCRTIFAGTIAEVDTTDAIAVLTVNDYRSLFTISMPRHFYQAQCRHTLFDNGCTLNAANYAINGTVAAGSTQSTIIGFQLPTPPPPPPPPPPGAPPTPPPPGPPSSSGTFTLGRIVFTGGLNNTFQRTIKSWDGSSTLSLLNPLPFAVSAGDTFTVYPGCNKLLTTCTQFGNQANYGGQDLIPPPEVQ